MKGSRYRGKRRYLDVQLASSPAARRSSPFAAWVIWKTRPKTTYSGDTSSTSSKAFDNPPPSTLFFVGAFWQLKLRFPSNSLLSSFRRFSIPRGDLPQSVVLSPAFCAFCPGLLPDSNLVEMRWLFNSKSVYPSTNSAVLIYLHCDYLVHRPWKKKLELFFSVR